MRCVRLFIPAGKKKENPMFCNRWHRQIESCVGINQYVLFIQLSFSGDTWLPATNHIWTGSLNTESNTNHFVLWNLLIDIPGCKWKRGTNKRKLLCQLVCKQTILTEEKNAGEFLLWDSCMEIDSKGQQMFSSAPNARITFNFPCFTMSALCTILRLVHLLQCCVCLFRSIRSMHEWRNHLFGLLF